MRLDKYLKVSRIVKRRQVAKEAAGNGMVSVNGKPAKAGHEVKIGDIVKLTFPSKTLTVRVLSLAASAAKDDAKETYEVVENG